MIYVISGMIGAGKTTYADKHFLNVTDFDRIGSKEEQIRKTLQIHAGGMNAAHVTCYPTEEELQAFGQLPEDDVRWIWIDTDERRCRLNVLTRERIRDLADIGQVLEKNHEIFLKRCRSDIAWEDVTIFPHDQEERW